MSGTGGDGSGGGDERGWSGGRSADLEYVPNIRVVPDPRLSRSVEC